MSYSIDSLHCHRVNPMIIFYAELEMHNEQLLNLSYTTKMYDAKCTYETSEYYCKSSHRKLGLVGIEPRKFVKQKYIKFHY